MERSKPASELQTKPVAASRMASYHAAPEKKSDWEEVMRKLSTASMDESETLAQRVDMIRGMLEQTSEEEKRVMTTKVLSNIEETVKRLQSTVNLVKSLVWVVGQKTHGKKRIRAAGIEPATLRLLRSSHYSLTLYQLS